MFMAAKHRDPAFLYYDADVALDVAHMNRTERGCYFDLLQMYRKFRGYTMEQIGKILGTDMVLCWSAIELVLEFDEDTRKYHIPWLKNSLSKKAQHSEIQRERIQKYWDEVRKNEKLGIETPRKPRKKVGNTTDIPRNNNGNTTDIPLETETETKEGLEDDVGGVEGEEGGREGFSGGDPPPKEGDWENFKLEGSRLPAAMMEIVLSAFPDYPCQEFKDYAACWRIAYEIAAYKNWKWQSVLNGNMDQLLAEWKEIVTWARGDPWHSTKALSFWQANFQGLIQAKNNGTRQKTSGSATSLGTSTARTEALKNW